MHVGVFQALPGRLGGSPGASRGLQRPSGMRVLNEKCARRDRNALRLDASANSHKPLTKAKKAIVLNPKTQNPLRKASNLGACG